MVICEIIQTVKQTLMEIDAKNGDHLWSRTSASGDLCFVSDNDACAKHGPRVKCASCKIIVHAECISVLTEKLKVQCRTTFQDSDIRLCREKTEVKHHWIPRRSQKGKCQYCGKSFQSNFPFGGKVCNLLCETLSMSCTWCKTAYHNKDSCFKKVLMNNENCRQGIHGNIIVPPTWIVKLPIKENENFQLNFTIKPIPSSSSKPLLVFINPKSGGNQGTKLMRIFQWLLNPRQVFDLTEGGPKTGLELYRRVPNLRILACGGDGTVGWILSMLDELKVSPSSPIAVLPLGTGNDLARSLGWGGGYTDEPMSKILSNVQDGEIVKLDRWHLLVEPNPAADLKNCEEGKKSLSLNVVNNYFSLGVDALIALEFHEAREARPDKFNSRFRNKMFYGQAGGKDLLKRKWKDLCNFITLECDGKDITHKLKEHKIHSVLFLNIPCYGGGTRPWGNPGSPFQNQSTDDGKIEVIGLTTYQLPLLQAGGHGTPIAQCHQAKLVTSCTIPAQVDGEPCRLLPSMIQLGLLNTVNMVAKTSRHGNSKKEESVEKRALPVKQLGMIDYEHYHHHKETLKEKAVTLGSLNISLDTDLTDIRSKVNDLVQEKDSLLKEEKGQSAKQEDIGVPEETNSNWWFLDSCTAEKFFRIDQAQEQLYYVVDICDQELYILHDQESSLETMDPVSSEEITLDVDDLSPSSVSSSSGFSQGSEDYKYLIENNAPISEDLITAAKMGNLFAVSQLHALGYDLTKKDHEGRTALHHAAFIGNTEVVCYLVSYGPPELLDIVDDIMYHTALHRAATRQDRLICSLLVCAGCSLDIKDKQGMMAHQLAALVGDKDLAEYLETMKNGINL